MFLSSPAIHLSPRWGLGARGFGVSIQHSAPLGLLEAGGISIALPSRSLDRSAHPTKWCMDSILM